MNRLNFIKTIGLGVATLPILGFRPEERKEILYFNGKGIIFGDCEFVEITEGECLNLEVQGVKNLIIHEGAILENCKFTKIEKSFIYKMGNYEMGDYKNCYFQYSSGAEWRTDKRGNTVFVNYNFSRDGLNQYES